MAPIPADIVRVRLVFDLHQISTVADQAIMGFHLVRNHLPGNTTDWPANTQEIASKTWQKWTQRVTTTARWPTSVSLSRVDAYHLDTAGKTLDKGTQGQDGSHSAWTGTSGNPSMPWEVACAVSMYGYQPGTFTPDAKSKRGRYYLPPFATTIMGNSAAEGLFDSSTIATVVAVEQAAFLNDVNLMTVGGGAVPDTVALVVLSRTKGVATPVQTMRVGHRPDRQSRRGRKLPELYSDVTITHS